MLRLHTLKRDFCVLRTKALSGQVAIRLERKVAYCITMIWSDIFYNKNRRSNYDLWEEVAYFNAACESFALIFVFAGRQQPLLIGLRVKPPPV